MKSKTRNTGNTKNTRGVIKTEWNLGLLYKGHDDPQIEKDLVEMESAYAAFEKKYKNRTDYLEDDKALAKALDESEALIADRAIGKPFVYFHSVLSLNSGDAKARAMEAKLHERYVKLDQKIHFFNLSIAKIPLAHQVKLLKSPVLAKYRYCLKVIFNRAKHDLSEPEEKIMSLKSLPSHDLWTSMVEKLLGAQTIEFEGKTMPFSEAMEKCADLPTDKRRALQNKITEVIVSLAPIAESELNAVVTNKKINDELRGFKEPYDSTILGYENDRKSVLSLVSAVTRHFPISHRFMKLKAKLMKLPHLEYADRNAGISANARELRFEEAISMIRGVFAKADKRYVDMFDSFLERGQIDAFPKQGKRGGAFCSYQTNLPTLVFMNFTGSLDGVSTLAHEMGHAIHSELSKSQPYTYQGYSTSTAEVASTFFEAIAFDAILESASDEEKIALLHNRINDDIQVIFRQIACFNFETDLHNMVREKGALSKEEIAVLMKKHMMSYFGPAMKMRDEEGNIFVSWWHIRSFFYVYSYAFGQLISKALYAEYKKDKSFIKKINQFLSAGSSDSPENIFKSIGIDATKPDFWEKGLQSIEKDIETLEKLTKNR